MRIFYRSIISLFIPILIVCNAFSQDIHFNKVSLPDEVTNVITAITQDQQGNIWFSADGISRYDGVHLKKYVYDRLNPNSIASNRMESIYADKKGFIWAGGYGGGLNKLDPRTGIFTHYQHDAKNPNSISGDTVTCILEDKEGMIWIGTDIGGLDRMDPSTGKFENFRHKDGDPGSLSFDQVRVIYEDKKGELWIGCGGPFHENQPGQDGGLNRYDRKTGKFISYKHDDKNPFTLIDNRVRAIFEDTRGTFWIGTAGDGLHTMNRESGTFERHTYDPAHPDQLSRPPQRKFLNFADDHITFITEDRKGFIWIGSFEGGVSRYDPLTKKIIRYNYRDNAEAGYSDSTSWWAFISRDGVMWISTWLDEMYKVDPSHQNISHTTIQTNRPVFSVLEEPGKGLYLATDSGLMFLDKENNQPNLYVHDPKNPESLTDNRLFTIFRDRKDRIWVGSQGSYENGGLFLFNPEKQSFKGWHHDAKNSKSLTANIVFAIYEDQQSNLWVGTLEGLDKMDVDKNEFTHYQPFPEDSIKYKRNLVISILEDLDHNLWVATVNEGGLHILDRKTGKFKHYLNRHSVLDVFQDSDGVVWAGTEEGLFSYDKAVDSFHLFKDQSTATPLIPYDINEDKNKNLWVTSIAGIYRIDADRKISTRFNKSIGYNGLTTVGIGLYKTDDDRFIIGNITGFYSFYPDKISSNPIPPEIFVTDFQIANQSVNPGSGNAITENLLTVKKIELKYNQDVFSFFFNVIHYSNPEANRALYMLENYDKEWRNSGSERTAFYYNIPPGRYTFRIKAASSYGVWAERSIDVIISPPWWLSWWAYILYGLLVFGIGLTIHRTLKQRVIDAERERSRTRELAQAKEIEKAYHELKTTQTQLIQSEKMASLGELTAGIAHEIQNPLNFVNNFSEVNTELIDEMQQEMEKGNYADAKEISDSIKQNEQKINFQGKRADAIVKSMLQHSRSSNDHKEPTNINSLADEYLRLAYHGLRAKDKTFNATLVTDFDPNLGLVNVIPQDIGRVMLNLYNNAFYAVASKAASASGNDYNPTITVTTKLIKESEKASGVQSVIRNPQFAITVTDNGSGIPDKVKAKIFQPFFTTKPTGQGTGLGLSLSYDIIKAHGGEIKVDSKEGEYTAFIIQLPV